MKRRNFIGALSCAVAASAIGISTLKKDGHLERFTKYFESYNGFKMNGFQIAAYIAYEKGLRFYFPAGHGMTTLFKSIARFEAISNSKRVLYYCQDYLEGHDKEGFDFYVTQKYRQKYLHGREFDIVIYDVSATHVCMFYLGYSAETVVRRDGVVKKRFPNLEV